MSPLSATRPTRARGRRRVAATLGCETHAPDDVRDADVACSRADMWQNVFFGNFGSFLSVLGPRGVDSKVFDRSGRNGVVRFLKIFPDLQIGPDIGL